MTGQVALLSKGQLCHWHTGQPRLQTPVSLEQAGISAAFVLLSRVTVCCVYCQLPIVSCGQQAQRVTFRILRGGVQAEKGGGMLRGERGQWAWVLALGEF